MAAPLPKKTFTQNQLDGLLDKQHFCSTDLIDMGIFNSTFGVSMAVRNGEINSTRIGKGNYHLFTKENVIDYCNKQKMITEPKSKNQLESISNSIRSLVDALIDIEEQMDVLYYTSATEQ